MSKFSAEVRRRLLKNPHIEAVSESRIEYTLAFKLHALKRYEEGLTCKEIFIEAGIDLSLFRFDYAKNTLRRWKRLGKDGLKDDKRGRTLRPKKMSQEEEIEHLKAEIWILKKLQASAKNEK